MPHYSSHSSQLPLTMADKVAGAPRKRKESIPDAIIHLTTSFNNTVVCIRKGGETLAITSAGASGFKGNKKGTIFGSRVTFENAIDKAIEKYRIKYKSNLARVEVRIKGPGQGAEQAIMALKNKEIEVTQILNTTGIPHNGPRAPKRRRV